METLLLLADDLDDAIAVLRHFGPRILSLLGALMLFTATGIGLLLAPPLTIAAMTGCAAALEVMRRRRLRIRVEPALSEQNQGGWR